LLSCSFATLDLTVTLEVANVAIRRPVFVGAKRLQSPAAFTYVSLMLICMAATTACAQQQTRAFEMSTSSLPDAPLSQLGAEDEAGQTASTEGFAIVSGVVQDTTGAAIPGAQVILTHRDGTQVRTMASGEGGEFAFTKLPAGSYLVLIHAKGFATFTSGEFDLSAQQPYEVPNISLSVASADTEVTVRPTEVIAAEQIRAEEKQRLFGVLPNFYVSYVKDPAPLTTKQKFTLATHDTLDWTTFVGVSATAGIEQANNSFAGYGQGAAGYGKRWAAQFGDGRTSDYLSNFVFASLLHEDPRYFYQGTGTTKSRLYHAVSNAWVTRSDSGKNVPNFAYILGIMGSGALSNTYYPHADRGVSLVFTNALLGFAGRAGGNVLQEFIGKRLTKNASKSANAEP
jgi:Carboxypeptidase regulatory-like domain